MAFLFGLRNTAATVSHLVAQRAILFPTNKEFVGMIESIMESLHGFLMEGLGSDSGSNSSRGSHHPSRECFMAETPEGHVKSIPVEEATPMGNLGDTTEGDTMAPPYVGVEQLKAQKWEINEAGQQLVQEYALVDREIKRRGDGGHAHAVARDVNRRIIADDETLLDHSGKREHHRHHGLAPWPSRVRNA